MLCQKASISRTAAAMSQEAIGTVTDIDDIGGLLSFGVEIDGFAGIVLSHLYCALTAYGYAVLCVAGCAVARFDVVLVIWLMVDLHPDRRPRRHLSLLHPFSALSAMAMVLVIWLMYDLNPNRRPRRHLSLLNPSQPTTK